MSAFTDAELQYLSGGRQLGRHATVGADGTPHVVPVGWIYNAARDTIDVVCGQVLLEVSDRGRPGDQQHPVVARQQPCERDLRRRRVVPAGHLGDRRILGQGGRAAGERRSEWEERHERDLPLATGLEHGLVLSVEDAVGVLNLADADKLERSYHRLDADV